MRVWEPYLTEQDKQHLAASTHRSVGFGTKPALLLVDLYRGVFGDKPEPLLEAIKTWPGSCGMAGWNAIPYIQKLLGTAREVGIPIIHITALDGVGVEGWGVRRSGPSRTDLNPEEADRARRRSEIMPEVGPLPGEAILKKTAPSAFWGTPLIGHLNYLGVDTIITVGESTSGCLRASVVDGCANRFRMIVVEEGAFDRHEATHALNLFDMHQKYADVISLAEAVAYMKAVTAPAKTRELVGALA